MAMARLVLLACLVGAAGALNAAQPAEQVSLPGGGALLGAVDARAAFHDWVTKFKRAYRAGEEEFERRFEVFLANMVYVREYNALHTTHQLGMNAFADMTQEEFAAQRLGYTPDPALRASRSSAPFAYADVVAPAAVDWKAAGGVTAVKDQGQCGSCWAFSTTGSLEGANFVTNGALVSLSEQELIDCDKAGNDRGCNGGLMDYAYDWIIHNGGLDTEADYPYTAADSVCDATKKATAAVSVTSFQDVPPNDEASLKKAVSQQPVAIAIAASGLQFQLYSHGVFDGQCSNNLDHGVLVVGYGTDEETGKDFWLVKNSWGEAWGESGYVRMAMNHSRTGLCGLAMVPSYPLVAKAGPPAPPGPTPGPTPSPTPVPPPPSDVTCDASTSCPSGTTCCCTLKVPFINMCLGWGCCPYPQATCCTDGQSCCPSDHPVCDLTRGACTAATSPLDTVALGHKFPATKHFSRSSLPLLAQKAADFVARDNAVQIE